MTNKRMGRLTVVVGAMGGGKTSYLIEEARRCEEKERLYVIVKSDIDRRVINEETGLLSSRGAEGEEAVKTFIRTHDGKEAACLSISSLGDLPINLGELIDVLIVDEGHFFSDTGAESDCLDILAEGVSIVCASLRTKYNGESFNFPPWIMTHADTLVLKDPDCAKCREENGAIYSSRIRTTTGGDIQCGGLDDYEPLCRQCYKENFPDFYARIATGM